MCFRDLCVTTTCFFASSTLKLGGGGSFNCLYKAKKSIFDKKRPFLAGFHEKWHILVRTDAVNCVCVICVSLQSAFLHPAP